jgi:GT2 family glycosyltransferase/glycosyltransferase involved in cell wall biosynthesis
LSTDQDVDGFIDDAVLGWNANAQNIVPPQLLALADDRPRRGRLLGGRISDVFAHNARIVDGALWIEDEGPDPNVTVELDAPVVDGQVCVIVETDDVKLYRPSLYLDFGDGFSEGHRIQPVAVNHGKLHFAIRDATGLRAIRFDPTESACDMAIRMIAVSHYSASHDGPYTTGLAIIAHDRSRFVPETGYFETTVADPEFEIEIDASYRYAPVVLIEAQVVSPDGAAIVQELMLGRGRREAIRGRALGDGRYLYAVSTPASLRRIALRLPAADAQFEIRSIEARIPTDVAEWPVEVDRSWSFWRGGDSARALRESASVNRSVASVEIAAPSAPVGAVGRVLSYQSGRITGLIWNWQDDEAPLVELAFVDAVVARGAAHRLPPEHPMFDAERETYGFDIRLSAGAAPSGALLGVRVEKSPVAFDRTVVPFDTTGIHIPVSPIDIRRDEWLRDIEFRMIEELPTSGLIGPLVSILTPVYNVADVWLRRMVESVCRQTYTNWELCLVDDGSPDADRIKALLDEMGARDPRVRVMFRDGNGGISAATNDAIAMAKGEYVALLDNDDMLTCDALEHMVSAILANDAPDWLYSDECRIDEEEKASAIFAKPDWSPLMMLNYHYTGHLTLYRTQVVRDIGGFRTQFDFSQDYDLALRLAEVVAAEKIVHVERVLYGWRMIEGSSAADGKPEGRITNVAALQEAVDRRGWGGTAIPLPTANRVVREVGPNGPLVTIVIPSDNATNIDVSIRSILDHTSYSRYEIIVVTNSKIVDALAKTFDDRRVIWARYDKVFNFSDKCNVGAEAGSGDYVVCFNDDVRVLSTDWIEVILEVLTLPGVGVVGPKLLYEDGLIQHAGMVTGVRRLVGTAFHAYPADTGVHFNFAQCVREVSLICGALLAMPMKLYREIGGYDAENAPINHSDVDLCFRVREAGYSCVYTPHATLIHIGHTSLAVEDAKEVTAKVRKKNKADPMMIGRFPHYVARDPYFTASLRDLVYIDSVEPFKVYPGKQMAAKKDAFLISHDLTRSGAPKVVVDMAKVLLADGYLVTVASPFDGAYREVLSAMGVTVIIDPLITAGHDASLDFVRNFDLCIVNTIVGWRAVRALKVDMSVYWYTHETRLVEEFAENQPGFVEMLETADLNIWAGSEESAAYLRRHGANPQIMEYGADDITNLVVIPQTSISVFGTFEPRKGQDLAVVAFQMLTEDQRKNVVLKFFGRVNDEHFRRETLRLARGSHNIEFHGELNYERYREELRRSDVVFIPSRDDTLPLVSLDALALGKPLLLSAATGTSKYVVDGESAFVADYPDPSMMAAKMVEILSDPARRARVGEGARAVFARQFTRSAFRDRLIGRITEALH